jgi:hypothetical protein
VGLFGLCILVSWLSLFLWELPLPLPLGILPLLALTLAFLSGAAFWGTTAGSLVLYVGLIAALLAAGKGKRWGAVFLTVVLVLDLAANLVLLSESWWYLLAAALDMALLVLSLHMAFHWENR